MIPRRCAVVGGDRTSHRRGCQVDLNALPEPRTEVREQSTVFRMGLQPQDVRHQRIVTWSAPQQAVEGPHESANPSSTAWKAACAREHEASVAKSARQMLFVKFEIVRGILGYDHATLSCRPGQNLSGAPMPQLRQGSPCYDIVSTLPELLRNRDREMLVEEQSQSRATRRLRPAAASASSARSRLRWIHASISSV